METCYLDWAASAPPYEDIAREAVGLALEHYANTSSGHPAGKAAAASLEEARALFAGALGALAEEIVFTSGGSESDAIMLLSALNRRLPSGKGVNIVLSAVEHSAVYAQAMQLARLGVEPRLAKPGADGIVRPESVAALVDADTAIVTVMAVNNEIGAIQPLKSIGDAARAAAAAAGARRPPIFYSDAVQALGKIAFKPAELGLDAAGFSAHKLGGPRGIGALWLRRPIEPLACGGGQERGMRAGTHNLAGAWAFARAAARAVAGLGEARAAAIELERRLIEGLARIPGATVIPRGRRPGSADYSPFILSMAFPGLGGETMERALGDLGVAVSTGSACSHGAKERRILAAMGVPAADSFAAIRVSTGRSSTAAEIDYFLERAEELYGRYGPAR